MFTLSPTHEAFPHNRLRSQPKGVRRTYEALLACPLRAMVLACLASPRRQRWEVRESLRARMTHSAAR
jgi:hypothetical protein